MAAPPLEYAFSPFTEDERWAMQRFLQKVDYLKQSAFAKADIMIRCTPAPGAIAVGGPAWRIELDGADEPSVKAAVADFRQLYTDSNTTSAMAIVQILQRSARRRDTDAARDIIVNLRKFRKALQQRRRVDPRGTILEESPAGGTITRAPEEILKAFFNGEYFHDERAHIADLGQPGSGVNEMLRHTLQTAMQDFIEHWGRLGSLVERILATPSLDGS